MPTQFCKKNKSKAKRKVRDYRRNKKIIRVMKPLGRKEKGVIDDKTNVISPLINKLEKIFYCGLQFILLPINKIQQYIMAPKKSIPEVTMTPTTIILDNAESDSIKLGPSPETSIPPVEYMDDGEFQRSSTSEITISLNNYCNNSSANDSIHVHHSDNQSSLYADEILDDSVSEIVTAQSDLLSTKRSITPVEYMDNGEFQRSSTPEITIPLNNYCQNSSANDSIYVNYSDTQSSFYLDEILDDSISETASASSDLSSTSSIFDTNKNKAEVDDELSTEDEEIIMILEQMRDHQKYNCMNAIKINAGNQSNVLSIRQSLINFISQHPEYTIGSSSTNDIINNDIADSLTEFDNNYDEFYYEDTRHKNIAPIARPKLMPTAEFFEYYNYNVLYSNY